MALSAAKSGQATATKRLMSAIPKAMWCNYANMTTDWRNGVNIAPDWRNGANIAPDLLVV
ncbi:MAG: hypothetical protein EBW19_09725 [Betaproteobacteria bacterium]|nr:hypothetical protein [Betaproteobacteria bacterium]